MTFEALELIAEDAQILDCLKITYTNTKPVDLGMTNGMCRTTAREYLKDLAETFPDIQNYTSKHGLATALQKYLREAEDTVNADVNFDLRNAACGHRDNIRQLLVLLGYKEPVQDGYTSR